MRSTSKRMLLVLVAVTIFSTAAFATNIPLNNWSPAPYVSSAAPSKSGPRLNISANALSASFMPLAPCRVYDSRFFGPATQLAGGTSRTINVAAGTYPAGFTACTGIPSNAVAYSLNITVFGSTAAGSSYGFITAYATGTTRPVTSTMNFLLGSQTSNAAAVPVGTAGAIDIYTTTNTHFTLDINGYYTVNQLPGNGFASFASNGIGVQGTSSSNVGVYGFSTSYIGVLGSSTGYNGVWAQSTNHDGLYANGGRDGTYSQGVRYGLNAASTGTTVEVAGVYGAVASNVGDSAGVEGHDSSGVAFTGGALSGTAGVYGYGRSGVAGVTSSTGFAGVIGMRLTSPSALGAFGMLGYGTYGVYSNGNTGATGTKSFVEPHPTDPSKVIRYVSLEGNEAGTYFRGTARIVNGEAVIAVPESFKFVTDEEGLTIQVTPVGGAAVVWVASEDLDQIVLRSAKDVKVHYLVQGVRRAYKNWEVISDGPEYQPMSPDGKIPDYLNAEAKRRLIENGTYNPEGTVNMNTAERMGWAAKWRQEAEARAKAAEPAH